MTEPQPDIEIYIKRAAITDIISWLETHFDLVAQHPAGDTTKVSLVHEGQALTCTIFEKAAKGGFVSILFENNHTPWATDEACASNAFEHFGLEIRCSTGGWTDDSADAGGWYRFTDTGKSVVNWLT